MSIAPFSLGTFMNMVLLCIVLCHFFVPYVHVSADETKFDDMSKLLLS